MDWQDLKEKYQGLDFAKFLMDQYLKYGTYGKVAQKYGVKHYNVSTVIQFHAKKLEEFYPRKYKEFRALATRSSRNSRKKTIEELTWEEIKEKYKGVERALFVINEAVRVGGVKKVGEKYNLTDGGLGKLIWKHKAELKEKYPKEYEVYKKQARHTKSNRFNINIFEMLDKEISEFKFIDFVVKYDTDELSIIQLIEMAKEKGVRVYRLNDDGEKKFVV